MLQILFDFFRLRNIVNDIGFALALMLLSVVIVTVIVGHKHNLRYMGIAATAATAMIRVAPADFPTRHGLQKKTIESGLQLSLGRGAM